MNSSSDSDSEEDLCLAFHIEDAAIEGPLWLVDFPTYVGRKVTLPAADDPNYATFALNIYL